MRRNDVPKGGPRGPTYRPGEYGIAIGGFNLSGAAIGGT